MKILISGGTGLIGKPLVNSLLEDKHQVSVLTRSPERARLTLPQGAIPVGWDGRTPDGWGEVINETDAVINLAGESLTGGTITAILTDRWTSQKKTRIIESRVNAGRAISEAIRAAKTKPEVLIQSSAVGYYSPSGTRILTEDSPAGSDFSAQTCLQWEKSTKAVEELGVRRVILRTGLVFTMEGGVLPLMLLPFRLFVGGALGDGTQPLPWIHIRDEIEAIKFLITNPRLQGVFNLSAPNPVDYNQYAKIAAKVLKRPNWLRVPAFALKLALGEKAALVLQGQHALPERLLQSGYKFTFKTLDAALTDLIEGNGD
ncbi:MAG: TIGR01777 family oxidoreductase [Anaerolineales bacterium]|nr:TIGR01777 family oxidoreductase [Anaerolineales bacterium]